MSVMHYGFLRTMKANYEVDEGGLRVIRPLAYCRETMMKEYALSAGLPVINENCPACFEEPKERARTKKLLSKEENLIPALYNNLRRAILPLMEEDMVRCCDDERLPALKKTVTLTHPLHPFFPHPFFFILPHPTTQPPRRIFAELLPRKQSKGGGRSPSRSREREGRVGKC